MLIGPYWPTPPKRYSNFRTEAATHSPRRSRQSNKCYATCAQFADATLSFLHEKVPRNWVDLCDSVTDNFRVIKYTSETPFIVPVTGIRRVSSERKRVPATAARPSRVRVLATHCPPQTPRRLAAARPALVHDFEREVVGVNQMGRTSIALHRPTFTAINQAAAKCRLCL
jgi:hypothetical protein